MRYKAAFVLAYIVISLLYTTVAVIETIALSLFNYIYY
jgi:hypothetical protein